MSQQILEHTVELSGSLFPIAGFYGLSGPQANLYLVRVRLVFVGTTGTWTPYLALCQGECFSNSIFIEDLENSVISDLRLT